MGKVGLSKNAFHENRHKAIGALEAAFSSISSTPRCAWKRRPVLRDTFPRPFDRTRLRNYLKDGQDVTILGPEGSGRSTLAAEIVGELDRPVFWYTVRPGINDSVEGFAFALGLFAYELGEPLLWLELMASQGKIRFDTLAELINFTLGRVTTTPLLCIDDADALDTVGNRDHAVLMRLWDGLRSLTTRIIIGRQMVLNTDQYLPGAQPLRRGDSTFLRPI